MPPEARGICRDSQPASGGIVTVLALSDTIPRSGDSTWDHAQSVRWHYTVNAGHHALLVGLPNSPACDNTTWLVLLVQIGRMNTISGRMRERSHPRRLQPHLVQRRPFLVQVPGALLSPSAEQG